MNDEQREKMERFVLFLEKIERQMPMISPLYGSAFEVLVFCIISLRTKDEVAYPAADRLFALARIPEKMAMLSHEEVSQAIYPAGFYQRKAHQIIAIAKDLAQKGLKDPPSTREELLAYDGVGLKTANLTLSRGFGLPAICVDIHVHRIANRMGIVNTKDPDATERELSQILDKNLWISINPLLVYLGQHYCGAKPKCTICPFIENCLKSD